jgi:hypothetical protein
MRLFTAGLAAALMSIPSCDSGPLDTVPPSIQWVSPAHNATLDPGSIVLVARAHDEVAVKWVVFFIGADLLGFVQPDDTDTFRLTIELPSDSAGPIALRAFAYDRRNNGASANITIYVRR